MARTAQKVDSLAAEGEEMTEALTTVLSVAEEQGTVAWGDVSDDLTSGQWGRLIEQGLLIDADGEGFVIDDPEGVREALEESDADVDEDDDSGWTQWDKIAALGAVGLFAGYSLSGVRNAIGSTVDIVLGPLNAAMPFYLVVLVLAMLTGMYSTILQGALMDTELMGEYQERMQDLKERRKAAKERDDDEALERIQQEQMDAAGDQLGMFKAQFRPMVWIMLLTIPAFLWMYWMILDGHLEAGGVVMVLPIWGPVESWRAGILGPMQLWLIWYFVCSLSFNQIIRKALHIQTTPTG
jgi:uncharacterized membrane protein (DUF106 family)